MGGGMSGAQELRAVVGKFSSSTVLVVGDIMVDRYYWGTVRRISPEAPVPVVEIGKETRRLGGAANVAHNISTLGGRALLCGVAGDDREGEWLAKELEQRGIGSSGLIRTDRIPTTVKSRVVAHSQQVVRFDREIRGLPASSTRAKMESFIGDVWRDLDAVVISDYAKGVVSDGLLDRIRSLSARRAKIPVCVDPKSSSFERYRRSTVITPNLQEAIAAAASGEGRDLSLEEVGARLLRRTKAGALLVTRGEEGMSLFEKGRRGFHIPAVAREVYDVTGAGDTVVGTLALALAAGATPRQAAYLSNAAAGVVVEEFGTVPVHRKQLLAGIPRALNLAGLR